MKIMYGKDVEDNDDAGLNELYYSVSDCLVTLRQLNYASDIYSSDTLRQVVTCLPRRLRNKWSEKSISIQMAKILTSFTLRSGCRCVIVS